jgi:menaquinone-specific isochorismate synthase
MGYGKTSGDTMWGGQAFSPKSCQGVWSSFPPSLFFTPLHLHKTRWKNESLPFSLPPLLKRQDLPTFPAWQQQVKEATDKISQGDFEKVVLARQTTLSFRSKIDPDQLMRLLSPLGNVSSLFCLQIDRETTFLGATPEKLFHRKQKQMVTEALAGTQPLHGDWTLKEAAEIDPVRRFIDAKLPQICDTFQWNSPQETTFGSIKHLYQSGGGVLKNGILDKTLIDHLHPTPALGGFPQAKALSYILQTEPFHRGWYGGIFGMQSPEETDLAVAIRSALICDSTLHLFSGVGIVKHSCPFKEWDELDRKISHIVRHL